MSTTPLQHLYRSLLREIRLASRNPRSSRNLVVENGIREMIVESNSPESARKLLMETRDFMRASRIHSELLKRYTPLADMTDSEKIRASARKVGLEPPLKYKRPE